MKMQFKVYNAEETVMSFDMELIPANKELLQGLMNNILDQFTPPLAPVKEEAKVTQGGYRGFMHLKCPDCGKIHSFNSYEYITHRPCGCGAVIPLHELKRIHLNMPLDGTARTVIGTALPLILDRYAPTAMRAPVEEEISPKPPVTADPLPIETNSKVVVQRAQTDGYKGYLYIHCSACDNSWGFNSFNPITEIQCKCGNEVPLHKLKKATFRCPDCGNTFRYRTNHTDPAFEIKCKECGTFNTLAWDQNRGGYLGGDVD